MAQEASTTNVLKIGFLFDHVSFSIDIERRRPQLIVLFFSYNLARGKFANLFEPIRYCVSG